MILSCLLIFVLTINNISSISFNQPKLSSCALWDTNAITIVNESSVGMFINIHNTIYMNNQQNNRILSWHNDTWTSVIDGNLINPSSIFITETNEILIDNGYVNGRVDRWSLNGTYYEPVMYINSSCISLFVDIANNLYCSLANEHRVLKKVELNNTDINILVTVAGTGCPGPIANMLDHPNGIFVDKKFNLYVADTDNNRIQYFQPGQIYAITLAGHGALIYFPLNRPTSIIFDEDNNMFIVDSGNHRIIRSISNNFECLCGCSGEHGSLSSQLNSPQTIAFDTFGNLFVTDYNNHRIQKFNLINNECAPRIFWSFDNTSDEFYNKFNGIGVNNPTYLLPGYNGAGACLQLNKALKQSVTIASPPFLNMSYTSFTVEAWMYANTLSDGSNIAESPIFSQFEQNSGDRMLHLTIRNRRIYLGFYQNDLLGNIVLNSREWYHLAYVYDYQTRTQYVYINGYLDNSHSPAGPYKGTKGDLIIGAPVIPQHQGYFDGCLDSIGYYDRAKKATEILNDATLAVFLSFDSSSLIDSGPLKINGTGTNYSFTSFGQVNKALSLSTATSHIQIIGLQRFGRSNWPYSISIWINPTKTTGGTIVHLSEYINGGILNTWCMPIIGFTSSGQIAINSYKVGRYIVPLTGSLVPLNTWTHVVATYSPTNGERLYVNNTLVAFSSPFDFLGSGVPMTITLGSSLSGTTHCYSDSVQKDQFYGSLDEFYVYARELTQSEISALYYV